MATKGKINVDFTMRYIGALRANRIVANPNRYSTINYKDIVSYAARAAHVPESSVEVAMDALYDALSYFVLNGHNVKIDGLGTFFFGINAYAQEQMDLAGADAVHRLKIGYLPEKDLREQLNNVAVTTTYSNPGNLSEDSTVPPKIASFGTALTQGGSATALAFGDTRAVPENGLYLIIKGARLSKVSAVGVMQSFRGVDPDSGETFTDSQEFATSIVARTEKEIVVSVPRASMEGVTISDAYLNRVIIAIEDSTDPLIIHYSNPYAVNPAFNDTILFGGLKGGVYVLEEYKQKLAIAAAGADEYLLIFKGANLNKAADKIAITGCTAVAKSLQSKEATYQITNVTGDITITLNVPELNNLYGSPIVITTSQSSTDPVVLSLKANGISVNNGGSSTVQAGQTYNFVFSGANLSGLSQSNLVVPEGATVSNFAATASQVSFSLTVGEEGGNIGLNYNGSSLFSVAVTIPTDISASVTSIGGVGNNGTLEVQPDGSRVTLPVVGTGLNSLSASNFVMSGCTMTLATGSDTARNLTIAGNNGFGGGTLRVQVDETTIFTLIIDTGDAAGF